MDFKTMTAAQLGQELNRFRDQLFKQGMPITDSQKRRFYALQKAYQRASQAEYI